MWNAGGFEVRALPLEELDELGLLAQRAEQLGALALNAPAVRERRVCLALVRARGLGRRGALGRERGAHSAQ